MTVVKRTQGRPPRSSGINGREKLIEATRLYLRSNRKMILTRTEIAQGCGVTPALISYYFKDKRSLLEAVTKPLIRSYRQQLAFIVGSEASTVDKMRHLIRLLIELNTENAFLVDYMLRDATAPHQIEAEDQAVIDVFHGAITGLIGDLIGQGRWRSSDLRLAEIALWGVCRAFGEAMRAEAPDDGAATTVAEDSRTALDMKVDYTFALFADGTAEAVPSH